MRVLLIEDNPGDARLIQELLKGAGAARFELAHVERLEAGLPRLSREAFDALLLDLDLPDSRGLETLGRVQVQAPAVPIVVLTGLDDEASAIRAVQAGAQDYLVKGQVDGDLLVRALRYAIERKHLLTELEEARQREQRQRELRSLGQLTRPPSTTVTAQLYGLAPLRESVPEVFNTLVGGYGNLLDLALEQRAYRVEHDVSERIRSMAERMGFVKAGPRDVVEVHTTALKAKSDGATPQRALAFVEEGRLMVLELMGHLVAFYRNYAVGVRTLRKE